MLTFFMYVYYLKSNNNEHINDMCYFGRPNAFETISINSDYYQVKTDVKKKSVGISCI